MGGAPPADIAESQSAFDSEGLEGYWRTELRRAMQSQQEGRRAEQRLARIYAELGDRDHAFQWLNASYDAHSPLLVFLRVDPNFDVLHADARFDELLKKIRLIG